MAYLPGSHRLLTCTHNGTIHKWALGPSGAILMDTMAGHTKQLTALVPAVSGRLLLSASEDGSVRLWNTDKCLELQQIMPASVPHQSEAVAKYTCPDPSALVLSERRPSDTRTAAFGVVHVISGAMISTFEMMPPASHFARASDAVRRLDLVDVSRGHPLADAERMLLLSSANNTLQLVCRADGNARGLFAPSGGRRIAGSVRGASQVGALPSGGGLGGLSACVYEPELGCALVW